MGLAVELAVAALRGMSARHTSSSIKREHPSPTHTQWLPAGASENVSMSACQFSVLTFAIHEHKHMHVCVHKHIC